MSTQGSTTRVKRSARAALLLNALLPPLLAGCQVASEPLPIASTLGAVTTANGLALNSLGSNGLALNGLALNGLALNGLALNGLALNGLALNGLALNGLALNGLFTNGLALNGLALNGLALNGLALNGLALNGLALNGMTLDGVGLASLPAAQQESVKTLLRLLAECALPSGACVTLHDATGGANQVCGAAGLDPGWQSGASTPGRSAQLAQCVLSRGQAEGAPVSHQPVLLESFKKVLRYMVECALPEGRSITIADENGQPLTLAGGLGLSPEWESGALSARGERRVSACLAARVNAQGKTVRLSLRAPGMAPTGPVERATYRYHEGAFWGNLFSAQPYLRTCAVDGSTLAGRECTQGSSCGFQSEGSCASSCATHDGVDGTYAQCQGADDAAPELDVVNVFLPYQHRRLASFSHTCAVSEDGSLRCWGDNSAGQLGDGTTVDKLSAVSVSVPPLYSVAAGRSHTCGLASDGAVWCWGDNSAGQLGDGTTSRRLTPVRSAMTGAVALMAGESHTCALASDGAVWCWGDNSSGQLGDGTTVQRTQPVRVAIAEAVRVALGHRHSCALTSEGAVWCWGKNDAGQLGDGTTVDRTLPVRALAADATSLTAGKSHACALKADQSIWCWGSNAFGQLGDGSNVNRPSPVPTAYHGYRATAVAAGTDYTCSSQSDGKVACWGSQGCQGGASAPAAPPKKIPGLDKRGHLLELGHRNAFVEDAGGRWLAWGCNDNGELGIGSTARVDGEPVLSANQSCGNAVKEPPRESALSCGSDFCKSCDVTEVTHGQAACGACGEKLTLAKSQGTVCTGKTTYRVTDCDLCGSSGMGATLTCNTCEVCITAQSCQSCTIESCTLCGSK